MRSLIWLTLLTPMLCMSQNSPGEVGDLPKSSVRFAILVGVEQYDDPNIAPIKGPANDVIAVKVGLEKYAGFADDNIVVLSTSGPYRRPTRDEILTALSRIRNIVPDNGLLLFMFSGHGISRGDRAYLLPSGARLTDDEDLLQETSLGVDLVRKQIAATGVKQAIVLLDACRDDPQMSKGPGTNSLTKSFTEQLDFAGLNKQIEASAVFFATALGSRAYVDGKTNLGYFTEAIADGLSGKAADDRGAVTLSGLLDYVQTNVPRMVSRDLGVTREQKPFYVLTGYQPSKLILARPEAIAAQAVILAQQPATVEGNSVPDPRSPRAGLLDYSAQFESNRTDEGALSKLGQAAFLRGNYDWTIKFLEQAKAVQVSKVWMSAYPFLAGAYLLGPGDDAKFKKTLDEMIAQMRVPNSYLHSATTIESCLSKLGKVRGLLQPNDAQFVDSILSQATEISANLAKPERSSVTSVCTFLTEGAPGAGYNSKNESCFIPDINHLDGEYHQGDFICCGGGGTSATTASDIPAGIEIKSAGYGYWSLYEPKLSSDKFSVVTYCMPPGGSTADRGCGIKTTIFAHYKY